MSFETPIKWAGGKRWFAPALRALLEGHDGALVVPFAGGLGATFHCAPRVARVNDVCGPLVGFWRALQGRRIPYQGTHSRPEVYPGTGRYGYYRNRARFRGVVELVRRSAAPWQADDGREALAGALFYYLNRVGFNGLYRENRKGVYNVPWGGDGRTYAPDQVDWDALAAAMRDWQITWGPWDRFLATAADGDFVWADPPYHEGFTSYVAGGFDQAAQEALCRALAAHSGPVLTTNAPTPFIRGIYAAAGFTVRYVVAPRGVAGGRDAAPELVAARNLDPAALDAALTFLEHVTPGELVSTTRASARRRPTMAKSKKLHISRVAGNLKGEVDVTLGRFTLLLGPSGSGKSAIANNIEYALTEAVSDIAGRDVVKATTMLATLVPGGGNKLSSMVRFSDGTEASSSVEIPAPGRTRNRQHQSGHDPAKVLPVRSMLEELGGSPERARRYLLERTQGAITEADILSKIPEEQHTRYRTLLAAASRAAKSDPATGLLAVRASAAQRAKEASDEQKAHARIIEEAADKPTNPPTEDAVQQAKAASEEAASRMAALVAEIPGRVVQSLYKDGGELHPKAAVEATIADLTNRIAALNAAEAAPDVQAAVTRRGNAEALLAVIDLHVTKHLDDCAVCGTTGAGGAVRDRADEMRQAVSQLLEADVQAANRAREAAQRAEQRSRLEGDLRAYTAVLNAYDEIASARASVHATHATYAELQAAFQDWNAVTKARGAKQAAAAEALEWQQLIETCDAAIKTLLDGAIEHFVSLVQKRLPERDRFGLRLNEGDREVCQFGLLRCPLCEGKGKVRATESSDPVRCTTCDGAGHGTEDDYLHVALSGGEWARVTAALAIACGGDAPFKLAIPPDRGVDGETLREVMAAFSEALKDEPVQIVLTSCVKYKGRKPKGWKVVKCAKRAPVVGPEAADLPPEPDDTEDSGGANGAKGPGEAVADKVEADIGTVIAWLKTPLEDGGGGYSDEDEARMSPTARKLAYAEKIPTTKATVLADGTLFVLPANASDDADKPASLLS